MASAAASETIMFVGAVLAAAAVVGALIGVSAEVSQGMQERARVLGDEMGARIAIVNDPANVATSPLTLYVKNTGTTELVLAPFVVLVDGVASGDWDVTVDGAAAEVLGVGGLATITVNDISPGAGDHRVVVIPDRGGRAALEFAA